MKKTIATLMLSGTFYFVNAQAARPDEPTGTAKTPTTYQDKDGKITEVDKGTTGHHGSNNTSKGTSEANRKDRTPKAKENTDGSKNKTDGSTTNMDATTPKQ